MLISILSLFVGNATAEGISATQTSYVGASMLEGQVDVTFGAAAPLNPDAHPNSYSYFVGNTLYVGNEDDDGNSVDAIVEFFWFQSSIDRGADFYVATIKARSTPAHGEELWITDWNDWAWEDHPVLSVEAMTSDQRGAFRWEWSVPFESYGIDAYGQITVGHQVGFGASAQGSAMTHGALPEGTNINGIPVQGEGEVQVKGFLSSEYKVQTQYDITLYEWDVYVNGRGDLMAWDTYLNLEARAEQSAYHEYFLVVQVDEGETFRIDEINVLGNFDTSWWNPTGRSELGVSLQNIELSTPFYEPPEEEEKEEEEDEWDWDYEPSYEPSEEPQEEVQEEDDSTPSGDPGFDEEESGLPELNNEPKEPVVSGCSSLGQTGSTGIAIALASLLVIARRKED
ncbi:MAG: hypothetical protein VX278_22930 [Myxococcota bacterium]|nr:hypothetical protein [Myxococcota bacterium]